MRFIKIISITILNDELAYNLMMKNKLKQSLCHCFNTLYSPRLLINSLGFISL